MKYQLSEDGTYYTVTGFEGLSSYVYYEAIIPPTHEGLPVKRIGAYAFDEKALKTVVIPEGVEVIESYAFSECSDLVNVSLPSTLKIISSGVFNECVSLTEIELPNNLEYIGSYAFEECKLSKIVIPASVTEIDAFAFRDVKGIDFTIYCRSETKPSGWHDKWNCDNVPVVWGYTE